MLDELYIFHKLISTYFFSVFSDMEKSTKLHVEETENLKKEISSVKESLAIQQAATDAERRHVASLELKLKQSELIRNQMEQAPLMVSFFSYLLSHKKILQFIVFGMLVSFFAQIFASVPSSTPV
jgi:hypothetical protein